MVTETIEIENIFDYKPDFWERDMLEIYFDDTTYLKKTPPLKKLNDLHLLFLIRKDSENRVRIMNMIKRIIADEVSVN